MNTGRKTIIMVDDDLTNLTIGYNTLEKHYDIITLNSGTRLLKVLEKKIPDLILLDVDMPEMNGYETIVILKNNADYANIPVVFLTAKSDTNSELKGLSLGAVDYITKPFSPPLLVKRIELHLLVESQKNELMEQTLELEKFNKNLQQMVDEKTATVVELQNAILRTIAELVEYRDNITGGHIERTQSYLRILMDALQQTDIYEEEISAWDKELLLQSAQLHDVGKIAIEDSILRKPDKLTPDEFERIKEHTVFGGKVFERIARNTSQQAFLEQAKILAVSHHEKWDGSGYPYGLSGCEIPLQGRLMAIVDVYDALVSDRTYKEKMPHGQAVDIIRKDSGKHFDPALVDIFLGVADEFEKAGLRINQI